jgi:hypothetical protein
LFVWPIKKAVKMVLYRLMVNVKELSIESNSRREDRLWLFIPNGSRQGRVLQSICEMHEGDDDGPPCPSPP